MKVFLIRHAEAIDYETETVRNDEYRYITPKGRKTSISVFRKIKEEFLTLEKIYSTPLIRGVQTAEILATSLKFKFDVEVVNELLFGSPPSGVADLIKRNAIFESIAFIGHNPMMSELVKILSDRKDEQFEFKKSGVCCIDYNVSNGNGKFQWYINPKTLEIIK
ncbi:MAG: histidine phosphatase family protein [Ignavibacteria bacterium]|nr:histidine phosphatase family protein [Ignavibacteria bacterium]